MDIASAKKQIKNTVRGYLETDESGTYLIDPVHQRPVFILGAPGIGKTAIMEQIAHELGIGIVSYSMTHHTRQSALGLPRIESHNFEGYEYEASEYTMSEIIGAIYEYMERTGIRQGILFLDEINCVSETLYPSMLQFLQFKMFGKHRVPEGWVVTCAGNPPEYNRSVHEFDIVTLDRMREIDVEPEYAAFKEYASAASLHPSVTTFLDIKKECFYKVKSEPGGGKSFVTTRGWEDLARVISLHERLGMSVDRDLISQFLRDEDIADQFATYYLLFEKYRSDYQIASILDDSVPDRVKERAGRAPLDERIAVIGLLLDALDECCGSVMSHEHETLAVRDVIRTIKDDLLDGDSIQAVMLPEIDNRKRELERKRESGLMTQEELSMERTVLEKLEGIVAACASGATMQGKEALGVIEEIYGQDVSLHDSLVEDAGNKIDNVFTYIDENLSDREMFIFVAELATRKQTTKYLARYGNDSYYAHNEKLEVDSAMMGLEDRARRLREMKSRVSQSA